YTFGCVLYAMLTGGPPFGQEGATEFYIKDCHVRTPPPPMVYRNPGINLAVEQVVMKCLEKDPGRRYPTCNLVMKALDAAMQSASTEGLSSGLTGSGAVVYPPIGSQTASFPNPGGGPAHLVSAGPSPSAATLTPPPTSIPTPNRAPTAVEPA